jgi:hypothetical protein
MCKACQQLSAARRWTTNRSNVFIVHAAVVGV